MHRTVWRALAALSSLALLLLVAATVVAQTSVPPAPASGDVLAALLVEVRGLRVAMEQMASAGPRVQLAMGRLQLQEQRVNTLLRRLDEVQASLASTERDTDNRRQAVQQMELDLQSPAKDDAQAERRRNMQAAVPELRAAIGRADADLLQIRAEESSLTQQIALEQGRWSDINRSLDELERALKNP